MFLEARSLRNVQQLFVIYRPRLVEPKPKTHGNEMLISVGNGSTGSLLWLMGHGRLVAQNGRRGIETLWVIFPPRDESREKMHVGPVS